MFTVNPFYELTSYISPTAMQIYLVVMVLFVIGGTILDMMHKKSAKYFFAKGEQAKKDAKRSVSTGKKVGIAVQTLTNEVMTSGEFNNPMRRLSHLMIMYGFVSFVVSTVVMIVAYPTVQEPAVWPIIWRVGAVSLLVGGLWFRCVLRVDVASEGKPMFRLVRADMFIVSLLAMCLFGLIWSFLGTSTAIGWIFFVLFIAAATFLFTTVLWSKFAHMFFKPAAAFQKRVLKADGSNENLPADYDLSSAEVHAKYPDIPEYMGKNPPNMGLGIKREAPRHY
jgi:hypothetical protein